jgi:hypothetical protein
MITINPQRNYNNQRINYNNFLYKTQEIKKKHFKYHYQIVIKIKLNLPNKIMKKNLILYIYLIKNVIYIINIFIY